MCHSTGQIAYALLQQRFINFLFSNTTESEFLIKNQLSNLCIILKKKALK